MRAMPPSCGGKLKPSSRLGGGSLVTPPPTGNGCLRKPPSGVSSRASLRGGMNTVIGARTPPVSSRALPPLHRFTIHVFSTIDHALERVPAPDEFAPGESQALRERRITKHPLQRGGPRRGIERRYQQPATLARPDQIGVASG